MARTNFDDSGSIADAIPHTPAKRRYPCFAEGCPMPGTIFPDSQAAGVCAYHYGVKPGNVPRVTNVLRQWDCVAFECREARRVLTGELASDVKAIDDAFAKGWERLQPLAGEWAAYLMPGNILTSKDVDTGMRENYGDWAKRLERFIGARVVEALNLHEQRRAA